MQNADSKGSAGTTDDSGQKDEFTSVSQHSRKPPVVGSQSHGTLKESVTEEIHSTELTFPIHPKVLSEVRDAALKYKEGNPVWADTCNNLAKSAESFLGGYGPCEEYFKYSKPEVLAL